MHAAGLITDSCILQLPVLILLLANTHARASLCIAMPIGCCFHTAVHSYKCAYVAMCATCRIHKLHIKLETASVKQQQVDSARQAACACLVLSAHQLHT